MRLDRVVVGLALVFASACGGSGGGGGGGDDDGGPDGGDGGIDAAAGGDGGGGGGDAGVGCGLRTCESAGATCGPIGDGCGAILECGTCDGTETCGGGGVPSVCGGSSGCVGATCDSAGATCGPIGDGCGGTVASCGTCDDGQVCGGGGTPSVCSTNSCVGLCQQQVDCPGGGTTSVSGVVHTPSADRPLPLYNISVYVPNAPLDPITTGNTSCATCDAPLSGNPLVLTTTDAEGHFVLPNMPVGSDIPLVIQSGKWRRKVTIPTVTACVDTPVAAGLTRFPRTQGEGGVPENNIPRIALTTGGADALECLLRKIGIADSEFTPQAQAGRVNLYAGHNGTRTYRSTLNGGATFTDAKDFWNSVDNLNNYDMVVLSCEGAGDFPGANGGTDPNDPGYRGTTELAAMKTYLDDFGGRVFASHWHHSWVEWAPAPMPSVATFRHGDDPPVPFVVNVNKDDLSFPKGAAFAQWLLNTGASTVLGQLSLRQARHDVDAIDPTKALKWIYGTNTVPDPDEPGVQYMSFNTPVDTAADAQCGRMVLSDIHVSNTDDSDPSLVFPTRVAPGPNGGCTSSNLLPEERALIFMLFDLASCVTTDNPICNERTCQDAGAECGQVADGCGDLIDCGPCTAPDTCGGGGTPNVCGNDGCVEVQCADVGAECGAIADGCGGTVDCGVCVLPDTCGGDNNTPNVCGHIIID